MSKEYWHFAEIKDGLPVMRDGTPIEMGKEYHVERSELCESGFHGSERIMDALKYAPGEWISKRIITDDIKKGDDKVCGKACIHTVGFDATEILRKFARMCALDVVNLWDAPDVVVQYLRTGDKSLRSAAWATARSAARSAAWATARSAARSAAWAAAWATARSAARSAAWAAERATAEKKQNRRLTQMINKALNELEDE